MICFKKVVSECRHRLRINIFLTSSCELLIVLRLNDEIDGWNSPRPSVKYGYSPALDREELGGKIEVEGSLLLFALRKKCFFLLRT